MMNFFHNLGNSIVAKIIFIALAVSMMAFWGLGGLTNTGNFANEAIEVDGNAISMNQLAKAFDAQRQKMSQLMGTYLSPKDAINAGLLLQVVQQQTSAKVSESIQNELGLIASKASVQKYVERNPVFADSVGNFDVNLFYAYLGQLGMTEGALAEQLKSELATQHLANAVHKIAVVPNGIKDIMTNYLQETRDVQAILIEPTKIKITEKPTESELRDYYEAYVDDFIQPEFRGISVIQVTPALLASRIEISNEEIDAIYEIQKDQYTTPEKRAIDQMRFDDEAAALSVVAKVTAKNFRTTAQTELNQTAEQTDFGWVAQNELLEDLATPVFAAKKGEIVGPISSPMGWHVLLVRDIQPTTTINAKEIRQKIREQLVNEKTYDIMYTTIRTEIDDILGAGDSLERVSEQLKLPIIKVSSVDISGKTKDGKTLDDSIYNRELLQELFTSAKGDITSLIEHGTGYLVARVDTIIPVAPKAFEEVRTDVHALWLAEKQQQALPKTIEKLLGKKSLTSGEGFTYIHEKNLTRSGTDTIPASAIDAIFQHNDIMTSPEAIPVSNGTLVFMVVKKGKTDAGNALNDLDKQLSDQAAQSLYDAVVQSYASGYKIKVNEPAIIKAFSIYQE